MSGSVRLKAVAVGVLVALFAFLTFANFVPKEQRVESPLLPDDGLRWGLDLQGGIHWVVGVELDEAIERELEFVRGGIVETLSNDPQQPTRLVVEGLELVAEGSPDVLTAVREAADDTNVLDVVESGDGFSRWGLTDDWEQEIRERTMAQVLEVLRARINDPVRGIPDSVVTRQGRDRVLVQIPGGQIDRTRARGLLKSTGFLEFKIVEDVAPTEEILLGRIEGGLPDDKMVQFEFDEETNRVVNAYLVPKVANITGDYLSDARVGFDIQQRSLVNFTFTPEGGEKFGVLTEENIGRPLAIVLDDRVKSAPTIQSRIATRGQITGRFSPQEAADLAVVLRAGSLSVPVVIEEERSIGPALGQDSIDRGVRASGVGLVLVLVLVAIYYRLSGLYAGIGLVANLVMLIGLMSMFEATLTLPGLAGLVLTVGMAVDANVIIFERIREELRTGKTARAAIATGFKKALWTVLDANITTLITALILFEFGTGPVKGFAVTLSVGICTSVFAALVITRLLFQIYPGNRPVEELSI